MKLLLMFSDCSVILLLYNLCVITIYCSFLYRNTSNFSVLYCYSYETWKFSLLHCLHFDLYIFSNKCINLLYLFLCACEKEQANLDWFCSFVRFKHTWKNAEKFLAQPTFQNLSKWPNIIFIYLFFLARDF